jgi:adenylosuccinate synthase
MPFKILILSGRVCTGKSSLAKALAERFAAIHVRTVDCLRTLKPDAPNEREALQLAGEALDRETAGEWVLKALEHRLSETSDHDVVVLDSARIPEQIEAVRRGYGNRVYHVHLEASIDVLQERYKERPVGGIKELTTYRQVMANPTEAAVDRLREEADVVISSDRSTVRDVLLRAASHAGLFGRAFDRVVDVIIGGQYGSEGKGQIAAYLAPEYQVLVRVGGPNAGHTVYESPKPYTFHHLPSGSRVNAGAKLLLGPGATIYLPGLHREIAECEADVERLSIDPQAMIITETDRAEEAELQRAMGSTAQGVGSATARRILDRKRARRDVTIAENEPSLKPFIRPSCDVLDECFRRGCRVMLEGTQGTGLSLFHGSYPYVTSRDTTVAGCLSEAGISPSRVRKVVMVCRSYPIRVQNPEGNSSGPMGREIDWQVVATRSGIPVDELMEAEKTSTTRRARRVAEFDWELLRRSASLNAPTDIAVTFADYLGRTNRNARRFDQLTPESIRFLEEVERVATAPVSLISARFHSRGVIDRRAW